MSRFFHAAFRRVPSEWLSVFRFYAKRSLLFAAPLLIATGCWSEVEYEPPKEPAVKQSTDAEHPAAEAPPVTATPEPPAEPVVEPPAPPVAALTAETTDEELFGSSEPTADTPPSADAPPLAEATSPPPAEEVVPSTEQPRPLLPHEIPSGQTPAPVEGGRYATTPSPSAPAVESPEATPPVGNRYATTPTEPPYLDDAPAPTEVPSSPSSAETPPEGEEPRTLLPHEIPTSPSTDEPALAEETTPMEPPVPEVPPPDFASLPLDVETAETDSTATFIDPANPRHNAWLLGSKWSLMILGEHAGAPAKEQTRLLQESQKLAETLGIELPKASSYPASQPTAAFLESALPAGRELGIAVGTKHGVDETALLEAAMKSNLLLVLGEARPDLIPAVVRSVSAAAERAKLPADLVEPFTNALSGSPTPELIDQAVFEFHRAVEEHLRAAM
ncbi:MAG: hypothetical protein WD851_01245 [Pirellulales bacterium]